MKRFNCASPINSLISDHIHHCNSESIRSMAVPCIRNGSLLFAWCMWNLNGNSLLIVMRTPPTLLPGWVDDWRVNPCANNYMVLSSVINSSAVISFLLKMIKAHLVHDMEDIANKTSPAYYMQSWPQMLCCLCKHFPLMKEKNSSGIRRGNHSMKMAGLRAAWGMPEGPV